MHSFKPTWKMDAPTELFILGYCLTGTKVKRLISYRVQLKFPEVQRTSNGSNGSCSQEVVLTLIDAGCALTPVLPWDKSCMFNSGTIICLREQMRCFSLFKNTDEPLCELELENHPWLLDGNGPFATAVDPWSGKIVVVSNQRLLSYRFEYADVVRPIVEDVGDDEFE